MGKAGDSFNKKEREKKRNKKRKEKEEKKQQRKEEGKTVEFMYVDANGNLTETPPDPAEKIDIPLEDIQISTPKYDPSLDVPQINIGVVKFFNEEKGFGFIIEEGTRRNLFVHVNNLVDPIKDNDKVTYDVESGPKGLVAVGVKLFKESDSGK